jgi:hypothetical protein
MKPPRANVPISDRESCAATLRKSGLILREIAERMGITPQRVWQLLGNYFDKTHDDKIWNNWRIKLDGERLASREQKRRRDAAAYAKRHSDRIKARQKAWREKNKDKQREYNRNWKIQNGEQHRRTYLAWFSQPSARFGTLVTNRVADAVRRGIEYDEVALRELCQEQPLRCAFCDVALDFVSGVGKIPNGPSIDRVDTRRGYVKGNIAVLCNKHNEIKGKATADEHRRIAEFIDSYSKRVD